MFGYVRTNKMELKHREILAYKGYYCGICMTLKKEYGNLSRLSLNYDTTFLQIMLTSLYEPKDSGRMMRCISHPHKKEAVITNEISKYCSAMNIILTYYKLKDDVEDDNSLKAKMLLMLIQGAFEKAKSEYPEKEAAVKKYLEELFELEKQKSQDIEEIANTFGYIMAEMFDYKEDVFSKSMYQAGFYVGKYIYTVDAFEDLEEDIRSKSYNPFTDRIIKDLKHDGREIDDIKDGESVYSEEFKSEIKQQLFFLLSCASEEIDRLPLIRNKGIIDNILFSGIVQRLNKVLKETCNEEEVIEWK